MEISREFLEAEISEVQRELERAKTFVIQAETSLAIFQMLLTRLSKGDDELCEGENGD
jgi:hypothetical protein